MLGIALDDAGASVVKPVARQLGINYPVVIGSLGVAAAYGGMEALPTAFLVGRDGRILQIYFGAPRASRLRANLQAALAPARHAPTGGLRLPYSGTAPRPAGIGRGPLAPLP